MLPHDFLPWKTVSYYDYTWLEAGLWKQVHDALRADVRAMVGKQPTPSLAIIDSQSVKTTEAGGPKGYDAGKKIGGRKRHLLVDPLGLVWGLAVLAASPVDWDGAVEVFERTKATMPRLAKVLADKAYRAQQLAEWIKTNLCRWLLETTGPKPDQKQFEPIQWRWIVERTFGWFGRYRRLSKDYESTTRSSETWISIAMTHRMCRLLYPSKNRDDDLLRRPKNRRVC